MSHEKKDRRILLKCIVLFGLAIAAVMAGKRTGNAARGARIHSLWALETERNVIEAERTWNALVFVNDKDPSSCGVTRIQRMDAMKESLRLDTWFILAYAPALALACQLVAIGVQPWSRRASVFGRTIAPLMLIAGGLDFVENIGMKHMVCHCSFDASVVPSIAIPSRLKWAFVQVGSVFILACLPFAAFTVARHLWRKCGNHSQPAA